MSLPKKILWIPTDPAMLKKNEKRYEEIRTELKKNNTNLTDMPGKILNWDEETPKK